MHIIAFFAFVHIHNILPVFVTKVLKSKWNENENEKQ